MSSAPIPMLVAQPLLGDDERIALPPALELARGPVLARVAARVADEAIRQRLDELGPAAAPDALRDVERGFP